MQRSLRFIDGRLQRWNSRSTILEVAKRLSEGDPCSDSVKNIGLNILNEFSLSLACKISRLLILLFRQIENREIVAATSDLQLISKVHSKFQGFLFLPFALSQLPHRHMQGCQLADGRCQIRIRLRSMSEQEDCMVQCRLRPAP